MRLAPILPAPRSLVSATACVVASVLGAGYVFAQPLEGSVAATARTEDSGTTPSSNGARGDLLWFELDEAPGWSGSLSATGGLMALLRSDARGSYAVGGAALRLRYHYFTIGGTYEASDDPVAYTGLGRGARFSSVGGFAGAYLPFHNWVDFEFAARIAQRTYVDPAERFGPSGYTHPTPVVGLSATVSDRSNTGFFGGRLGGGVLASLDLVQKDFAWQETIADESGNEIRLASGVDHIGGVSVALFLDVALDVSE